MQICKWTIPVVVFGLLLAGFQLRATAEEAKTSGSGKITGTVVDSGGKAVSSAMVRLMSPKAKGGAKSAEPKVKDGKGDKGGKGTPVAETSTDAEGKFTLKDVPAGHYTLMGMVKGVGKAKQQVEVKDGDTVTVELKLEPIPAK